MPAFMFGSAVGLICIILGIVLVLIAFFRGFKLAPGPQRLYLSNQVGTISETVRTVESEKEDVAASFDAVNLALAAVGVLLFVVGLPLVAFF